MFVVKSQEPTLEWSTWKVLISGKLRLIKLASIKRSSLLFYNINYDEKRFIKITTLHNDIQHNGIQHNDIQYNDIQHNDIHHNDVQHNNKTNPSLITNDTQHNNTAH